jgi:hypothetical protein
MVKMLSVNNFDYFNRLLKMENTRTGSSNEKNVDWGTSRALRSLSSLKKSLIVRLGHRFRFLFSILSRFFS